MTCSKAWGSCSAPKDHLTSKGRAPASSNSQRKSILQRWSTFARQVACIRLDEHFLMKSQSRVSEIYFFDTFQDAHQINQSSYDILKRFAVLEGFGCQCEHFRNQARTSRQSHQISACDLSCSTSSWAHRALVRSCCCKKVVANKDGSIF